MKARANGPSNLAARFRAFALPTIAGLVLLCPSANWARSHPDAKPAPSTKTASAPAAKQSGSAKSRPGGLNTGITVHGHWVIDVRNPDGKLVVHREFENNLLTTANPSPTGGENGAFLLARLLGHVQSSLVYWYVDLYGTGGDSIDITEPLAPYSVNGCSGTPAVCSQNLSVAVVGSASESVALTGTATVPSGFSSAISYVETVNGSYPFTGVGESPTIPVTSGQLVNVSVTFSFQ